MRMKKDFETCGIVSIWLATGKPYQEILDSWAGGWESPTSDKGTMFLPNDTPADHYATLEEMGIDYRRISVSDVLNRKATLGKTVLLLHDASLPRGLGIIGWLKNLIVGLFNQHWVVLTGYGKDKKFIVDWGFKKIVNGKEVPDLRTFNHDEMKYFLKGSYPRAAYTVGEKGEPQSWFMKAWAKWT